MITEITDNPSPENLEYRMYCLVLRQLSPINKGIQNCHACLEYALKYGNELDYQQYITKDKTIIMLDGGISQEMDEIAYNLMLEGIDFACFREPDLNNLITSICFLADERVWNKEKYKNILREDCYAPESEISYDDWVDYVGGAKNAMLYDYLEGKRLSL